MINKEIPYYLLFDEANELLDFQKNNQHSNFSEKTFADLYKVSCQSISYKVNSDLKDRSIQKLTITIW